MSAKLKYPFELFQLQIDFVRFLTERHGLTFEKALFNNTALYVRIVGFNDSSSPDENNEKWQKFLAHLPSTHQAEYAYEAYKQFELSKKNSSALSHSCFHTFFHIVENKFELHFDPIDSKGNLSSDRKTERMKELKELFDQISRSSNEQTMLFVRTWLLNIEAFNRLFSPKFSKTAVLIASNNQTFDNASWGQFITKDGEFRTEHGQKFRENWKNSKSNFNEYFPLPCLRSEMPVLEMKKFYN
jgi:hypothetical protein